MLSADFVHYPNIKEADDLTWEKWRSNFIEKFGQSSEELDELIDINIRNGGKPNFKERLAEAEESAGIN